MSDGTRRGGRGLPSCWWLGYARTLDRHDVRRKVGDYRAEIVGRRIEWRFLYARIIREIVADWRAKDVPGHRKSAWNGTTRCPVHTGFLDVLQMRMPK